MKYNYFSYKKKRLKEHYVKHAVNKTYDFQI